MRSTLAAAVLLTLSLAPVAPRDSAAAGTVYVDAANPASSDANPGTEDLPFRTITAALDVAEWGQGLTVLVKPAIYTEWLHPTAGSSVSPLTLQALGDGVEIHGGVYVSGRTHVVVDGFVIRGSAQVPSHVGTVHVGSSSWITLSNNRIFGEPTRQKAVYTSINDHLHIAGNEIANSGYDGLVLRGCADSIIEDNDIHDHVNKGLTLFPHTPATGNVIRRNRFWGNGASAICLDQGSYDNLTTQNLMWDNQHGIELNGTRQNRHLGDVIWGNRNDGIWVKPNVSDITIANCIIGENGTGNSSSFNLYVDSTSAIPQTNDNVWWYSSGQPHFRTGTRSWPDFSTWVDSTGRDTRSVEGNPRFVDAAGHDFRLTQLSPAIDAANTAVEGWHGADAAGIAPLDDPRIPNTGIGPVTYADRGAFEFVPSTLDADPRPAPIRADAIVGLTPNPVRGAGRIDYAIARASRVRLSIVDVQGRTVATLVDAPLPAGAHAARWEAALAPGLYFAVLETTGQRSTRRFARLR